MLLISGAVNQKAALNGGAWVLEASEGLPPFVQKDSLWGLLPLFMELSVPKKWGLQTDYFRIICALNCLGAPSRPPGGKLSRDIGPETPALFHKLFR